MLFATADDPEPRSCLRYPPERSTNTLPWLLFLSTWLLSLLLSPSSPSSSFSYSPSFVYGLFAVHFAAADFHQHSWSRLTDICDCSAAIDISLQSTHNSFRPLRTAGSAGSEVFYCFTVYVLARQQRILIPNNRVSNFNGRIPLTTNTLDA